MKNNKEVFIESCQEFPKFLYESICYKKSETPIYKSRIYVKYTKKVRKHNPKYSLKQLLHKIFKSPLYSLYNKVGANFIKLIGIYQLIILHFHVSMAEETDQENICKNTSNQELLGQLEQPLCRICTSFGIFNKYCDKPGVTISVTVFFFLFCCCKKSCCKKKKCEEGDFDYSPYMMGADGQMYNPMYQGQMMSPQMYQMGMMHPQMFPGQMMYPQMYQGGIQDPGMQIQGMQMQGMQMPGMQMQGMHNEEMQNQ
ncbi:hypothetical protein, conserved [Plasmodium vivax]|uniref:Uncharacterized protein n=1 Tax=Plasmodium vivax TaxID=5855 RepID=A0A1G4HC97_PLAVI|nr:hypothetical protein, conserved [Plasmodium vivax]